MNKKTIALLFVLGGIGAYGKLTAMADSIPSVEPVVNVEDISVKSGDLDPSSVTIKTEEGEKTIEEVIRSEVEKEFSDREAALQDRERIVTEKEQNLKAVEVRAGVKVDELRRLSAEIEDMLGKISSQKKEDMDKLANMYGNMKAKDAANILNTMDMRKAVDIIDSMSPTSAGAILGLMNPKRARDLTSAIIDRGEKIVE